MSANRKLTVFVAMPYTDFGPTAKWKPHTVEQLYRERVRTRLQDALPGRWVEVEIEKRRVDAGMVHESMIRAIWACDVLIADISGANPNVLFELGVRYGLRRGLTILTSQDERTPFDVNLMRVIRYGNRPDEEFLDDVTRAVTAWVDDPLRDDSPVLHLLDLEVVKREQWAVASEARVEAILGKASRTKDVGARLDLVRRAVAEDPFSLVAQLALAKELRATQDYTGALAAAEDAIETFPRAAALHKERGLILDRLGEHDPGRMLEAQSAVQRSIELERSDDPDPRARARVADTLCCLGGILRRRALRAREEPAQNLRASLDAYRRALDLDRHSTYAGLNILRILFLVPDTDSGTRRIHLRRMRHLCEFEVADAQRLEHPEPWWSLFDLGDALILHEHVDDGLERYDEALSAIQRPGREEILLSPLRTWSELVEADALEGSPRHGAEAVVAKLHAAIQGAD